MKREFKRNEEEYSLDQIKMTEWIWPDHDIDKHYLLNMTKKIINITTTLEGEYDQNWKRQTLII